jgi:hypothetical protein
VSLRRLACILALAALTALPLAAPAHAAFPGANGKIVFTRSGNIFDIYTMNPDGSVLTNVTNSPSEYGTASWSASGDKIVFYSLRDEPHPTTCLTCNSEIYTMNADGSGLIRLTNSPGSDAMPAWSPSDQKIVFQSRRAAGTFDLYTMNVDGTGVTQITNSGEAYYPAWSPDGTKIAFVKCEVVGCPPGTSVSIQTINPDGSGLTNVSNPTADQADFEPNWSPDGSRISFDRDSDTTDGCDYCVDVWVMNADGSGQTRLTNDLSSLDPAWSPDGMKIVFFSNRVPGRRWQIFTMNADGTLQTRVSPDDFEDNYWPDWQPLPTSSYPHPQAASQLQVSLVPTFKPCRTSGNPSNAEHAPPLSTNSCNPPQPGSAVARVGLASQPSAQFSVTPGDTDPTNGNQANVSITASLTDIQAVVGGDYNPNPSGADLTEVTRLRFTDKANGYGGLPATATEYDFRVPIDCSSTPDPSVGSACSANTTANTLVPGLIQEQRQTVVQAFRVRVDDAGANGIRGDSDDRIFATQGVFVP